MYLTSCSSCSSKKEDNGANRQEQVRYKADGTDVPAGRTVVAGKDITDNKQNCSTCNGTGKVNGKQCEVCQGYGYILVYNK